MPDIPHFCLLQDGRICIRNLGQYDCRGNCGYMAPPGHPERQKKTTTDPNSKVHGTLYPHRGYVGFLHWNRRYLLFAYLDPYRKELPGEGGRAI